MATSKKSWCSRWPWAKTNLKTFSHSDQTELVKLRVHSALCTLTLIIVHHILHRNHHRGDQWQRQMHLEWHQRRHWHDWTHITWNAGIIEREIRFTQCNLPKQSRDSSKIIVICRGTINMWRSRRLSMESRDKERNWITYLPIRTVIEMNAVSVVESYAFVLSLAFFHSSLYPLIP